MPEQKPHSRELGGQLERLAEQFLQARGLMPLQRNFSCRLGEIDLILQQDGVLVFVEVRYRRSNRFGSAAETVNSRKQLKLRRCAAFYLLRHDMTDTQPCRFDIIGITRENGTPVFDWIRNAF